MSKVKTKVEYFSARDKIIRNPSLNGFSSGYLVTAFTESREEGINLLVAKSFPTKPGKKKIAEVRKDGETILNRDVFVGQMAEILDMIDEEKKRFN